MKVKVYFRGYSIVEAPDLDIAESIFDEQFIKKSYVIESSEFVFDDDTDITKKPTTNLCKAMFGKKYSELTDDERRLYSNAVSRRRYRRKKASRALYD